MRIELQMVGAYQNTNKTFKNIPFVNGRASVVCADEHVAGICRYLQQYGAYQLVEAEVLQAKLDKAAGKKISKKTATDRVQRCQAALAQAQADLGELHDIDEPIDDRGHAAPPSRRPAPRVVTAESEPAPESTPEPVAAAQESEFDDGGSSDQQTSRRERSETPKGGKSSNKTGKAGK